MGSDQLVARAGALAAADSAGGVALRSFFRHHGMWAPGVRLFRRLSFGAKSAVVCTVMVLPLLALVAWGEWRIMQLTLPAGQEQLRSQMVVTAAVAAVALLLGAYLMRSFYLVMKGGLREVSAHLKAMTDGDLTTSPKPWGADEAALLMQDLAVMQASLRRIVNQVRESSDGLKTVSQDIAAASGDLAGRTELAASQLEQAAGGMSDISTTVRGSTENTRQAAELATRNAEIAGRGGDAIRNAVATMEQIRSASTRITDIIGVIDGIAFQTNILALNAAVEAARAGDQGRGFAVVANEVRSLAGRSAAAAKEVRTLITDSVDRVRSGTEVVEAAGDVMQQIVLSADTMRELLDGISGASRANSDALHRVGASIADLEGVTQQNAALVQRTADSADDMLRRAADMAAAVAAFKLSADSNGMTRKRLSGEVTASPQISIADLSRLRGEGFRAIICNRPDAEGPGQTRFADIERAAREIGLQARHQPIEPGKVTERDAQDFARLLAELPKPVLAYCRTGMRSTNLWKLSHPGHEPQER